jgi:hypothetical protein
MLRYISLSWCEDGNEDDEWNVGKEGDSGHDSTTKAPNFCIYPEQQFNVNKFQNEKAGKNPPCSTCGSSNVTAFSVSLPPTCLVFGVLIIDAAHQSGNSTNPTKKNQAWTGLPSSSSPLNLNDHPVSRLRGGFRGSCMWNFDDLEMDGACGETSALMGIDIWEMLRRSDDAL